LWAIRLARHIKDVKLVATPLHRLGALKEISQTPKSMAPGAN